MPRMRVIAAAVGALCSLPALADEYTNTYFFGDSLTDSGFYAPALPPGTGRFTTNPGPVWSEVLAERLGSSATPSNQGGTNFAAGGARVSQLPGIPPTPPTASAPPLRTQVDAFLAQSGGQADRNALHFVWSGANDIFFIASNPAAATAYLQTTTAEAAAEIARLSAAGARHIVVFNLPDIGATPFGASQGAAGAAGLTSLSRGYNQFLFTSLEAAGTSVIGLDAFSLLNEVRADPARYGFVNATLPACGATASLVCTAMNLVAPGADQNFVFADGVHPTTGGHRLVADYVEGMLSAPGYVGQLAEAPVRNQRALSAQLWRNAADALEHSAIGQVSGWASVSGGEVDILDVDSSPAALAVGGERRMSEHAVVGAALAYSRSSPDWGAAGGYRLKDLALSLYGGYRDGALSITGSASFSKLDFDTRRRVALGAATRVHRGSTEGSRFALGAQIAYALEHGAFSHGPVASLLYQHVTVPGFDEQANDGSVSSSLSYRSQKRRSTMVSAGWQARLKAGDWTPYASILLNRDGQAGNRSLGMNGSASTITYKLPTQSAPKSYTSVNVGVSGKIGNAMRLGFDVDTVVGKKDLKDTRVTASLRMPF
ncbi:MAG: autotransporter domain-containing protein [Rhodocyclaceae bacterium]|nr:autotransporter domain-containing protein [Rhodocyclaceae bacterium]